MPIKQSPVSEYSQTMFIIDIGGQVIGFIITSEPTAYTDIIRAWSYAVNQRPKTLNVPDYPAALDLMRERHPSWKVYGNGQQQFFRIMFNISEADKDISEQAE